LSEKNKFYLILFQEFSGLQMPKKPFRGPYKAFLWPSKDSWKLILSMPKNKSQWQSMAIYSPNTIAGDIQGPPGADKPVLLCYQQSNGR
jgi:hypothetical protein